MNCKQQHCYNKLFFFCFSGILLVGCAHVYTQPIHKIDLPSTKEKINLPVTLVITDDYRSAKWEMKSMGSSFTMPIGDNLVHHSKRIVRNVFSAPLIYENEINSQSKNIESKYILQPRVVFIEQTFGVSGYSEASTSIGVEWILSRVSGTPVWVETFNGIGVSKQGNAFFSEQIESSQKKRLQSALQNLFEKTQKSLLKSPLLRKQNSLKIYLILYLGDLE